jgi:hypothetical protein
MPLDSFQYKVLGSLAKNRTEVSVVAGGSVLHQHAFRLSDDQDFFHADGLDISKYADIDIATLESDGFSVDVTKSSSGLVEVIVSEEGSHPTRLQWVQSGLWNFFGAVEDETFGWRLHLADIAINKVLAAADRHEPRDFVDLTLIHERIMPLWLAVWAAPGKDAAFNPASLIERLARNNTFSQAQFEEVDSLIPIDGGEVSRKVSDALQEARGVVRELPMEQMGQLFVRQTGELITDLAEIKRLHEGGKLYLLKAAGGGTWPSTPGLDSAILESIVDEYGFEGSKIP